MNCNITREITLSFEKRSFFKWFVRATVNKIKRNIQSIKIKYHV